MKLLELRVDGYKNLGACTIPLADFNVVVGPNNSGKSNLLEVFRALWCLCFSSEDERKSFLRGTPFQRGEVTYAPVFMPEMHGGLSMGFTFESTVDGETWVVDFDAKIRRHVELKTELAGFENETLKAKQPSKTGPPKTYLRREGKLFVVLDKAPHPISPTTSAVSAVSVLYPEPAALPRELTAFLADIHSIARTSTYALSPEAIRSTLGKENVPWQHRISSFGLLAAMDEIFKDEDKATFFTETVCNILDLEGIHFDAVNMPLPKTKPDQPASTQRVRFCVMQRKSGDYSDIAQYSDGTLIVTALVASLILQDKRSGLTCIEELENCLHPRAQERLLRFLNDNSAQWQLIITTHSPYLINGVGPMDVLVAVADPEGTTKFVKPQDRKAINDLLKKGHMSFGDLMVNNFQDILKELP